jgi:CheY-like chemotaxis protein
MVSKTDFYDMVGNAYQSLYDFVRLRNHPLTQLLVPDDSINHKEKGWQAHHLLLDVVEELYPGAGAPPFSREWRRHRLMVLRYVEAMDPQVVADQLAISRRQYYREHAAAIEAVADILWDRYHFAEPAAVEAVLSTNPIAAMQIELARISQNDTYADLSEVIEGALAVLERVFQQNGIVVEMNLPDDTPAISIGHNLLRQVILGVLGYFAEYVHDTVIILSALPGASTIHLEITTTSPGDQAEMNAQMALFRDMLSLSNASITLIAADAGQILGFDLKLPIEYDCTVLAVDDNEDTLALYKRCLTPNRYRVITTKSAHSVLSLAHDINPDVIILDLMMPEQDGWDLLQLLSNQPQTAHIPIMICSVLKQKQLALSLGAAAFLEKPFTEQILLDALEILRGNPC